MNQAIKWLRRNADKVNFYWVSEDKTVAAIYGVYLGHRFRYDTSSNRLDIGFNDFDRWVNSTAASVIVSGNIMNCVHKAIEDARNNTDEPYWYNTLRVIKSLTGELNFGEL